MSNRPCTVRARGGERVQSLKLHDSRMRLRASVAHSWACQPVRADVPSSHDQSLPARSTAPAGASILIRPRRPLRPANCTVTCTPRKRPASVRSEGRTTRGPKGKTKRWARFSNRGQQSSALAVDFGHSPPLLRKVFFDKNRPAFACVDAGLAVIAHAWIDEEHLLPFPKGIHGTLFGAPAALAPQTKSRDYVRHGNVLQVVRALVSAHFRF